MDGMSMKGFRRIQGAIAVVAMGWMLVCLPSFAAEKAGCVAPDCTRTPDRKAGPEQDRRLALEGDASAQMALGLRYLMGNGVPADEELAQDWFLKAAQQGNVPAQVALATMLSFESDRQDLPAAARWFLKAAQQGNAQAMSGLVRLYETGGGVKRDMEKAGQWQARAHAREEEVKLEWAWKVARLDEGRWMKPVEPLKAAGDKGFVLPDKKRVFDVASLQRAAENGDDQAQVVFGALLATGDGIARDEAAAWGWFEKAAAAGNAQAQAVLGWLYALGWGEVKQDEAKAARWMEKAALGGLVPAKAKWGSMLSGGKGVKKDPEKGLEWFVQAAQEGDARARLLMGMMLVHQNRDEAAKWFYGAADIGDEEVLSALGTFYGWGSGPVEGESEKLSEVRRYAQRGEPEAQQMMGFLYGEGWGARRDPKKAEYWFGKAVASGDAEVWLPLGLLYAETGREGMAAEAFDKAVASGGFSLAMDGELLQMIFADSGQLPSRGSAVPSASESKVKGPSDASGSGGKTADNGASQDNKPADPDGRQARVARKRAFLESEVKKGNPAARLMMATIVKQGWGVNKDSEKAASLRSAGIRGMCAALKEKTDEEPLCSRDADDTGDAGKAVVPGKETGSGDSNVFRVTEGAK